MNKIAKFHKESEIYTDCIIDVDLPTRSTPGSAGYDFYAPNRIVLKPGKAVKFDTGICAEIENGWVLMLYPRSSLGMKGVRIANTTGIVDSDFYPNSIGCKLVNDSDEEIIIEKGERYMQGIFLPFGITKNDKPLKTKRNGGFGSTGK